MEVRRFFDEVYGKDDSLEFDVRAHVAITALLYRTPLRVERLADAAQCSDGEASETMKRLAAAGAVERLLDGSRSVRLTTAARQALRNRVIYKQRSSIDAAWDTVRAYLDTRSEIGSEDAAKLLGVRRERASAILSQLFNEHGRIQPVGKPRGRGVRYRLPT